MKGGTKHNPFIMVLARQEGKLEEKRPEVFLVAIIGFHPDHL